MINQENEILYLYIPVIAWAALLIIFFLVLARKYTLGKWDTSNPNPYSGETLGLPKGTLRGILTLTIMFVAILLEIFTLNTPEYEHHISQFLTAFQMVIAFYFGGQVMSQLTNAETKKTEMISENLNKSESQEPGDGK